MTYQVRKVQLEPAGLFKNPVYVVVFQDESGDRPIDGKKQYNFKQAAYRRCRQLNEEWQAKLDEMTKHLVWNAFTNCYEGIVENKTVQIAASLMEEAYTKHTQDPRDDEYKVHTVLIRFSSWDFSEHPATCIL